MVEKYDDTGRRPPTQDLSGRGRTRIYDGPEDIDVALINWGPQENLHATLWNELTASWGMRPEKKTHDSQLTPDQKQYVEGLFSGKTLGQCKDSVVFWFRIDNVSRATTHQLVRSRQASVMQSGGRPNDWRDQGFRMPETVRRYYANPQDPTHCVEDEYHIYELCRETGTTRLLDTLRLHLQRCKLIYSRLVDAGIPFQDARMFLPIGSTSFLFINYPYSELDRMLSARLEHVMGWEINCVAQLMLRQVRMHCPEMLWKYLGSYSDKRGTAAFAGERMFPPDGKYPVPENVDADPSRYQLRRKQNPFWVLHPDSMAGGPIKWVATNGEYPEELKP